MANISKTLTTSINPQISTFTRFCLALLKICLGLYGLAVLILATTSGWNQLIAIYPLFGAYGLNGFLIVCSIAQLGLVFDKTDRFSRHTLALILIPPLLAGGQIAWNVYQKWAYTREWKSNTTFVGGRYRPRDKDSYIRSISATVYMPAWKNPSEVNIQTSWNKTFGYDMEYAPNQPDNVHREGEDDYNDRLLNSPEYFNVYVHSFEGKIKEYVNPPHNCDIKSAIEYAQNAAANSPPNSVPCVVLGTNVGGGPIYGQDNWLNDNPHKYAATIFGGDSLHLFDQFGTAEKEIGGEVSQLLAWQKDFWPLNPDHFGH